ncbi:heterogeneous nuclear ribonucleoprotein L-like isoform X4 [Ranitomeya variabilis]|uniref:heterogeneous nuclear ribonucleoprotein L-like isoform X4 n=2 Tax=Ranitomeya variabilis TaxID=490064 RepID=UPI004056BFAB
MSSSLSEQPEELKSSPEDGEKGAASATEKKGAASATEDKGAACPPGEKGEASAAEEKGAASAAEEKGAASAAEEKGAASAAEEKGAASAAEDKGAACPPGEKGEASAAEEKGAASAAEEKGAACPAGESSALATDAEDRSSSSKQAESQTKKLKSSPEDGEEAEACAAGESSAQDSADTGDTEENYHKMAISPVVHVRGLAESVLEADLVKAIAKFGTICYVAMMPFKQQALVEFENTEFSKMCVTSAQNQPIFIGGQRALFSYSTSKKITRTITEDTFGGSNVLLISIYNAVYPVSVDIIYSVFNPLGKVERIVIFRRNAIKAMVEFKTVYGAQKARAALNGTDLFTGCGKLNIEYARPSRLNVFRNNNDSWDYTISSMNRPDQGNEFQGQGFQGNQPPFHNHGNGTQRPPFQGNRPPFHNQGDGPQRPPFQGNQPPFHNQGNGPQRPPFQGNQPPFHNQGNVPQRQPFQGNRPPFHNQGNGPQRPPFQGNQPPFQNQGNIPQRQPFQGNQPPFHNQGNVPQRQPFQGNQPFHGNQPPFHNQGNVPQRQPFQGNQPPFGRFDGYNQGNDPQGQAFQGNPPFQRFDGYNQGNEQWQDFQGNHPPNFSPNQPPFQSFDGYGNPGPMGPGDNPFPQASPFMQGGPPGGGLVAKITGLHQEKMNCDRVFSVFCLYGNVSKVKFMRSIPGAALVEMGDELSVQRAVAALNMVQIFGKVVNVCVSKQYSVLPLHAYQLYDGTPSYAEFTMSKLNRFTIGTQPSKNLMQPPSCVLRYYNVPLNTTEKNFQKLCEEMKVPQFIKHSAFNPRPPSKNGSGLLHWTTKAEAMEALIVLNHYQIRVPNSLNPYTMKLSFYTFPNL